MDKKLDKKLKQWFLARTSPIESSQRSEISEYRYIPKAYSSKGFGWGVYDKRENRFLEDKETLSLDDDKLWNEGVREQ